MSQVITRIDLIMLFIHFNLCKTSVILELNK